MNLKIFDKKIDELISVDKPKIAFGLIEVDNEIIESLEKSKTFANIILVGPSKIKNIDGFNIVISDKPSEKISSMLVNGEVDGIIRGTIDDFNTYNAYQKIV